MNPPPLPRRSLDGKSGGTYPRSALEHRVIEGGNRVREPIGWFVPHVGSTSAVYWITDEIAYTLDYNRGIDVLRFTGKV